MRKLAALILILGMAAGAGSFAAASGGSGDTSGATAAGVEYDWWGDIGQLSIVGEPGAAYEVYDSNGVAVAGGELDAPYVSFLVGGTGEGPDGATVYVVVDGDVLAATDPNWEW